MSAEAGLPRWTVRNGPWLLVALHLPFVIAPPVYTIARHDMSGAQRTLVVLAAVALGGIQLRHSLAARRDERPRGWPVTLAIVVALAYVPSWWFTWDWAVTQWFVLASLALLLRERVAVMAIEVGIVVVNAALFSRDFWTAGGPSVGQTVFWTVYWVAVVVMGGLALYRSARLVRVVEELQTARLELAELAVGRERLRVSRDLHDVLGQSLSAVSLKGDLALRLLRSDPAAARVEVEGLTELARGALRDMRAVTQDRMTVSLRTEVDAATALLGAAGIATEVDVDLDLAEPASGAGAADVLAWAVREGTTNLLRHSDAQRCWIRAARTDGTVGLEIVNDGVREPSAAATDGSGTGLSGLAERARALGGSVSAGRLADGRFRLLVEVEDQP